MSGSDPVLTTDLRPDGVAIVTLARPDRLNALSSEVAAALSQTVAELESASGVNAIVVAGEGRVFCAGADIAEFGALDSPAGFARFLARLTAAFDALARCPKPSVAALHGAALGGGLELALACDIIVADEGTRLGVPEIKLGLLPGAAGTARLPRQLPAPLARQMLLTGEPITAEAAHHHGLVAEVCPPGGALGAATALAGRLAQLPPLALAAAKRLLATGPTLPLDAAVELERQTVAMLFGTDDRAEGVGAVLEKRASKFGGS
jgi:enoyl-CoA hydratase